MGVDNSYAQQKQAEWSITTRVAYVGMPFDNHTAPQSLQFTDARQTGPIRQCDMYRVDTISILIHLVCLHSLTGHMQEVNHHKVYLALVDSFVERELFKQLLATSYRYVLSLLALLLTPPYPMWPRHAFPAPLQQPLMAADSHTSVMLSPS